MFWGISSVLELLDTGTESPREVRGAAPQISQHSQGINSSFYSKQRWAEPAHEFCPPFLLQRSWKWFLISNLTARSSSLNSLPYKQQFPPQKVPFLLICVFRTDKNYFPFITTFKSCRDINSVHFQKLNGLLEKLPQAEELKLMISISREGRKGYTGSINLF